MRLPVLATLAGIAAAAAIVLFTREETGEHMPLAPGGTKEAVPSRMAPAETLTTLSSTSHARPIPKLSARPQRLRAKNLSSLPTVRRMSRNPATLRRTFFRLAGIDRTLAVELALRLPGDRNRTLALEAIAREFGRAIPPAGAPAAPLPDSRNQRLGNLLASGSLPPLLILRISAGHPSGSQVAALASTALAAVARANPGAAVAMSKLHPDPAAASTAVATGWARTAPRAALDWARTLDPEVRGAALSDLAMVLAQRDAAFASAILPEIPVAERSRAVHGIASVWAGFNTQDALRWASSLSDPMEAQSALAAIRQVAPTGIGVLLRPAQNSPYPAAMELVPDSPAAKSGAIRAGDAIVAVGDGRGTWNPTSGQNLQSVVEWIRGEPNRPLQLQILPAGSSDPTQLRTVTLTREQLLFKRPQPGLPDA